MDEVSSSKFLQIHPWSYLWFASWDDKSTDQTIPAGKSP